MKIQHLQELIKMHKRQVRSQYKETKNKKEILIIQMYHQNTKQYNNRTQYNI